jgi:drug/metabolite transporter (DMT)-like permease
MKNQPAFEAPSKTLLPHGCRMANVAEKADPVFVDRLEVGVKPLVSNKWEKDLPNSSHPGVLRTAAVTTVALMAFASNSILCRLALAPGTIDATMFTTVRLVSGAATLLIIAFTTGRVNRRGAGNWISGAMLFLYAICFSLAYINLNIATGALILFCAVQLTMIITAIATGERPQPLQWLGLVAALGGFIYLVFPGLEAPSTWGSVLMTVSGVAWGIYTLRGRGNADPISATTDNFVRSVPFILVLSLVMLDGAHATRRGVILAIVSGAITSGIGYVIWYEALRGLTATRAATVQLTVPIIAALGGVLFMSEAVSLRLAVAAAAVLGGVGLVLAGKEAGR